MSRGQDVEMSRGHDARTVADDILYVVPSVHPGGGHRRVGGRHPGGRRHHCHEGHHGRGLRRQRGRWTLAERGHYAISGGGRYQATRETLVVSSVLELAPPFRLSLQLLRGFYEWHRFT